MTQERWHKIDHGSWWRRHTNGRDCWHAMQGYDCWVLRLVRWNKIGPPWLDAHMIQDLPSVRRLVDCKRVAASFEAGNTP